VTCPTLTASCAGHLLRGAKGFRAFDADGKEIGTFENINLGAAALLDLATVELYD
jgi:hypothetical protein